jgi:hypothetical protein
MKKRFSCYHRGLGKFCHRCRQAEALEARIEVLKASKDKDAKEQIKALTEEAKRLRTEGKGGSSTSYDEPEKTVE